MDEEKKPETKIMGQVVDEKERPVAGAKIVTNGAETRTLFDGSFNLENLSPGLYDVEVMLEGYRRENRNIELTEGEEVSVVFSIVPKEGDAMIYGYVTNIEAKQPIDVSGSVYMYRPTSNRNEKIDPNTGYYEFTKLTSGTYTIWTSILEYEEQKRTITVKEGEEKREDFLIKRKREEEVPWG